MTIQMLINELSKITDKNRKVVVTGIANYPFATARVKNIEISQSGTSIYISIERSDE